MSMKWRTGMRREMEEQDEHEMENWDEEKNGETGLSGNGKLG